MVEEIYIMECVAYVASRIGGVVTLPLVRECLENADIDTPSDYKIRKVLRGMSDAKLIATKANRYEWVEQNYLSLAFANADAMAPAENIDDVDNA